jgi:hypothetical protein
MTGKKMKEIKNLMKIFLYTFEISSSWLANWARQCRHE